MILHTSLVYSPKIIEGKSPRNRMKKITYTFLGWKVHQFCFEQELEQNLWSALNFTQRFDFVEDAGSQKTSKVMLMGASGCWLVWWCSGQEKQRSAICKSIFCAHLLHNNISAAPSCARID